MDEWQSYTGPSDDLLEYVSQSPAFTLIEIDPVGRLWRKNITDAVRDFLRTMRIDPEK